MDDMRPIIKKFTFVVIFVLVFDILELWECLPVAQAGEGSIRLLVDVQPSLALIVDNTSIDFGVLIAGNPRTGGHGIDISISTNSANGYYLAVADGVEGGNSSLKQSYGSTTIADFTATVDTPQLYETNKSKGLGITLYSASSNKENKWGTGDEYNDNNNKYCGIPESFTVIHQAPGYRDFVDLSSVGFILDVPASQKTGEYRGSIVLSAVTMLK